MCERWDPSRGLSIDWSRHKIDLKITWKVQGPKGKTSFSYPQGEWRLSEHGRQTETLVAIKSPGLWSPRCSGEGRNRERERREYGAQGGAHHGWKRREALDFEEGRPVMKLRQRPARFPARRRVRWTPGVGMVLSGLDLLLRSCWCGRLCPTAGI
jgi:hypothetical protein